MYPLSLRTLGSEELQTQVVKDIEDLLKTCNYEGLVPLFLVVGTTFIKISCAQSLRQDLKIHDWDYQVDNNYSKLAELYEEVRTKTIKKCNAKEGLFDKSRDMSIFYDPDESYISIMAINPNKKAKPGESSVKSGQPVEHLYFEEPDILTKFFGDKVDQ